MGTIKNEKFGGIIKEESRRLALLPITSGLIIDVLTGKATVGGMPEGATIIDCHYEFQYNAFMIKLEHESFDKLSPGQMLPMLNTYATYSSSIPHGEVVAELSTHTGEQIA